MESGGTRPANASASSPAAGPSQSKASSSQRDQRPDPTPIPQAQLEAGVGKKKRHRGGKKRRNRRQSFIAPSESTVNDMDDDRRPSLLDGPRQSAATSSFYRLKNGRDRSTTSLESEALLDHREQLSYRPRRRSNSQSQYNTPGAPMNSSLRPGSKSKLSRSAMMSTTPNKSRLAQVMSDRLGSVEDDDEESTDRTPLLGNEGSKVRTPMSASARYGGQYGASYFEQRRGSINSPETRKRDIKSYGPESDEDYDVNNPPSMPGTPKMVALNDVMMPEDFNDNGPQDAIIDIDEGSERNGYSRSRSPDMPGGPTDGRRKTKQDLAEMDVCYPGDTGLSEIGEEDTAREHPRSPRRRRRRHWPDLETLDEWATEEKEERNAEQVRAKKTTEPVMVGGRLRNAKQTWHREEDDAPYRYTYFNENFDATIHSRTISELCQFGATFEDLFKPTPPELSDASSDEDEDHGITSPGKAPSLNVPQPRGRASLIGREPDLVSSHSGSVTPAGKHNSQPATPRRGKRYGPRPTFWLDVLSPTDEEMKVLAKTFAIHQLTVEDIMVQEPREKVELFQNYYFVNYRSFEQDKDSEDYMVPVNIYVIVFRDGVLSFHFSMTPHPANVRRRIRQLNDYMSPSADWISYAIIDDVTDAFAPLVHQVEEEVDDIDDNILELHEHPMTNDEKHDSRSIFSRKNGSDTRSIKSAKSAKSARGDADEGGRMLKRIGGTRKKVMSLYRLLGNKADVIKGFAKRCTEQWQVAPRSEIGLYLGDIQDHIITMTGNLSHYENLLSRAHSNYLAQINIRTSERAEETNDVLGKLTVLGTIVLPLNLVTGIWGMNCWVPGQDKEHDFTWFFGLIGFMFAFALTCYILAKKLYGIV